VRNFETNEGNLIADALLWQATKLADDFGAPVPQVAMQNGGGIRNDAIIRSGPITELDTFDMLPFANFVAIVENISPGPFKEILENAVSVRGGGRYGQFSGFRMIVDPTRTAQVLNSSGIVTTPGRRVREVVLNTGQVIVRNGSVVPGAPSITVATIDFLARGGDQYPFRGATFTTLGVTYQQALRNYLEDPEGLDGTVSSALYAENVIRRALELSAPRITSVRDVPNDQGKQAQVTWSASRNDGVLTLPSPAAPPATRYTVWRRDTVAGASTWTAMADITPAGLVSYSAVVPTLFDSTSSGMAYSAFYVTAHTPDPLLTASSDPDSGFSVDNLKPSTPSGIFPKVTAGRIELNWKQPEDKDFRFFAVYRSASSGFTPSSLADTIGTTTDTTFVDTDVTDVNQYFYRVSAFDFSGNESNRSVEIAVALSPTGVDESAGPPIPDSYALSQNRPNPFNPSTTIQYALPHSGEVRLVIYNVLGQEIRTLVNGLQQAGYYTMTWDGRDNAGRVAGSGVYLYRITAGAFQQTRRMTLLK
jgi:hypothetical protein